MKNQQQTKCSDIYKIIIHVKKNIEFKKKKKKQSFPTLFPFSTACYLSLIY